MRSYFLKDLLAAHNSPSSNEEAHLIKKQQAIDSFNLIYQLCLNNMDHYLKAYSPQHFYGKMHFSAT